MIFGLTATTPVIPCIKLHSIPIFLRYLKYYNVNIIINNRLLSNI